MALINSDYGNICVHQTVGATLSGFDLDGSTLMYTLNQDPFSTITYSVEELSNSLAELSKIFGKNYDEEELNEAEELNEFLEEFRVADSK